MKLKYHTRYVCLIVKRLEEVKTFSFLLDFKNEFWYNKVRKIERKFRNDTL